MDVWAVALKRFWCIPSLNLAMVGRWLGHLPRGTFTHVNIAQAAPVRLWIATDAASNSTAARRMWDASEINV